MFRLFGITVYLHWSWFIALVFFVSQAQGYLSWTWSVLECLSLFGIVLMHEFGHQLACRSVGGQTHDIVLWPLGGVAYVSPPSRPGATLWSIAAGPLVNVLLFPLFLVLLLVAGIAGWDIRHPDVYTFVTMLFGMNVLLLVFNLLPIFPLDGGQILRSLLWFVIGRANSLLVASIIGLVGAAIIITVAGAIFIWRPDLRGQAVWFGLMCIFITLNCWMGFRQARMMIKVANAPRRPGFTCPKCKNSPPMGSFWRCSRCRRPFDTFATMAICPHCAAQYSVTACPECGTLGPITEWVVSPPAPPAIPGA